jgi:hypothetical protein
VAEHERVLALGHAVDPDRSAPSQLTVERDLRGRSFGRDRAHLERAEPGPTEEEPAPEDACSEHPERREREEAEEAALRFPLSLQVCLRDRR